MRCSPFVIVARPLPPDVDEKMGAATYTCRFRLEKDGSVTWHSPLGRDYVDPPPRRVMFV